MPRVHAQTKAKKPRGNCGGGASGYGGTSLSKRRNKAQTPAEKNTRLPEHTLGVRFGCKVFELRVLAKEGQLNIAGRTIALLGDDDVGNPFARRVGLVDLLAIDEKDHVGILFNRARVVAHNPL